jgi:hypothetical protein
LRRRLMIDGTAVKRFRPIPGKRGRLIEIPRCEDDDSPEEAKVVGALV